MLPAAGCVSLDAKYRGEQGEGGLSLTVMHDAQCVIECWQLERLFQPSYSTVVTVTVAVLYLILCVCL